MWKIFQKKKKSDIDLFDFINKLFAVFSLEVPYQLRGSSRCIYSIHTIMNKACSGTRSLPVVTRTDVPVVHSEGSSCGFKYITNKMLVKKIGKKNALK